MLHKLHDEFYHPCKTKKHIDNQFIIHWSPYLVTAYYNSIQFMLAHNIFGHIDIPFMGRLNHIVNETLCFLVFPFCYKGEFREMAVSAQ